MDIRAQDASRLKQARVEVGGNTRLEAGAHQRRVRSREGVCPRIGRWLEGLVEERIVVRVAELASDQADHLDGPGAGVAQPVGRVCNARQPSPHRLRSESVD